jgi:5,10-methylene-tetrahydrofolate dehydrogenase/methenyl tetrahydrofolate cyclohydrolase
MPPHPKLTTSVILLLTSSSLFSQAFTSHPSNRSIITTTNKHIKMTAQDIDGKSIAESIRTDLASKLSSLPSDTCPPGLAVMLVGSRKDSQTYVRMKQKACSDAGMVSFLEEYPDGEGVTEEVLLGKIREWNEDEKVHGILVQLPLPKHICEEKILGEVDPKKVSELVTSVIEFVLDLMYCACVSN